MSTVKSLGKRQTGRKSKMCSVQLKVVAEAVNIMGLLFPNNNVSSHEDDGKCEELYYCHCTHYKITS